MFKDTAIAAAAAAPTPGKGKKSKREKGGKKEDDEKDRTSPETTPIAGQEQMAAMRESGLMMSLPPSVCLVTCFKFKCDSRMALSVANKCDL